MSTPGAAVAPLAHAFGARYDAPFPVALFVLAGAAVVVVSFLLVSGRGEAGGAGELTAEPLPPAPRGHRVVATASVLVLGALVLCGAAGTQEVSENLTPVVFWLVVWVVVPVVVALVGDLTRPVNPFTALARLADSARLRRLVLGTPDPLPWPRALGWWVPCGVFTVVVAGELVVNRTATLPRVTAAGLAVYALVCLVGGLVVGAEAWTARGELFAVLFATWGRLGWWRFGAPGRRGFGGGLDAGFDPAPSRLVFVALLLVTVTYDGVLSTPQWGDLVARLPGGSGPAERGGQVAAALAFVPLLLVMLGLFGAFALASARAGGRLAPAWTARTALVGLLPSLVPIALGYQLAHYVQYVAINGQLLVPLLGDPAGLGWSLLPPPFTDDYAVDTTVMPNSVVWWVQLVAIVAAHVAAVVIAHRHLLAVAPDEASARRSEWPWLVAMVGYTALSLWLLAQPVVEHAEGGH
ncbi:MAG: hypothetical protein U0Q15_02830 [Kineosporiaceae bacterium]